MMEAILSSETSVTIYHTAQCVISEDLKLCRLFFENLEFFVPNIKFHGNRFGYCQFFFFMFAKGQHNAICAKHSKIRLTGSRPWL